ncbi:hypothetical protein D9623_02455 [Azospirillum brasilense]|nr:hypothetical protein D3868_07835 [Azospirillum brasilense]QEL89092.1 hypothetical protein D9621_02450 [Azospirillum brasilense]QEL95341.1 hypothetical protein D9623_02455 [Azospirillum brasilense]
MAVFNLCGFGMKPSKISKCASLALLCAFLVSGCALVEAQVDLQYKPAVVSAPVPGADSVVVKVTTNDTRPSNRDKISVKKNGYGMEMAAIRAKQDIPSLVRASIERELLDRGFRQGDGPVFVLVDVNRFYADYKTGFWSADNVAEVQLNVQVRGADGRMVYGKGITSEGRVEGVMLMEGEPVKEASEKALAEAVRKLVTDEFFLQALIDAQRSTMVVPARVTGAPTS